MNEERAQGTIPPRDFWREVPCGHPQDPVGWYAPGGWTCHCAWALDPADAISDGTEEGAPGAIVPCGKCGCYPALARDGVALSPAAAERERSWGDRYAAAAVSPEALAQTIGEAEHAVEYLREAGRAPGLSRLIASLLGLVAQLTKDAASWEAIAKAAETEVVRLTKDAEEARVRMGVVGGVTRYPGAAR